jgi:hypothetical protein
MSVIDFTTPRLVPIPLQRQVRGRDEEQTSRTQQLLLTGLIAALYVGVRIGLTYTGIGH